MKKDYVSKEMRRDFFERFATLIAGAFTFVAGLAWNEAVQSIIKTYIGSGSTILSQLAYAVIITIVAIIAIMQINSVAKRLEGEMDNNKETK